MISLYIFDMGGVISTGTDAAPLIAEHLKISQRAFYEMAGDNIRLFMIGAISEENFWERFSQALGRQVNNDLFQSFFSPQIDRKAVELVRRLRKKARVVVGTNTIDPHYAFHEKNDDYSIFDAVYASNRIGLAKPAPEFFKYILQKERCRPQEAVFVDDTETNILAARKLGIHSFVFKNVEELLKQFSNLPFGARKDSLPDKVAGE